MDNKKIWCVKGGQIQFSRFAPLSFFLNSMKNYNATMYKINFDTCLLCKMSNFKLRTHLYLPFKRGHNEKNCHTAIIVHYYIKKKLDGAKHCLCFLMCT